MSRVHCFAAGIFLASGWTCAAESIPLGPRSDFGRIVLSESQVSGGHITLEQLHGSSFDAEPAYLYPEISGYRKLGKAVGRLDLLTDAGSAFCTAFLISEIYLMTNGHCFEIEGAKVQAVNFVTDYVETGVVDGIQSFSVNPIPLEISSVNDLDYAILEVFGNPSFGRNVLRLSPLEIDQETHSGLPLIVIGHPRKMAMHISRKECRATSRKPLANRRLRHTCDTLVGNSGSPVISEDSREVIALHHAGDADLGVNFAVPISLIAQQSLIVAQILNRPPPVDPNEEEKRQLSEELVAMAKAAEENATRMAEMEAERLASKAEAIYQEQSFQSYQDALAASDLALRIKELQGVIDKYTSSNAAKLASISIKDARRILDIQANLTANTMSETEKLLTVEGFDQQTVIDLVWFAPLHNVTKIFLTKSIRNNSLDDPVQMEEYLSVLRPIFK